MMDDRVRRAVLGGWATDGVGWMPDTAKYWRSSQMLELISRSRRAGIMRTSSSKGWGWFRKFVAVAEEQGRCMSG